MPHSNKKKKKRGKKGKKALQEKAVVQQGSNSSPRSVTAVPKNDDEGDDGYNYDPFIDEPVLDIYTFDIPSREECPICCVPFPFENDRVRQSFCCGKMICRACIEDSYYGLVHQRLEAGIEVGDPTICPFCRESPPDGIVTPLRKLVKMGNDEAMVSLAWATLHGDHGLPCDPPKAFEIYHRAARAGSCKACGWLGDRYFYGDIVVKRDLEKAERLYSRGARLGNPRCLYQIGTMHLYEDIGELGDYGEYYIAAASMGFGPALDKVREDYMGVRISKEDYARALQAYQAAHEETKSLSRKRFEERLAEKQTLDDLFDQMGLERLGEG